MSELPQPNNGVPEPEGQRTESPAATLGVPWVTYAVIGVCGVIFAYLNLGKESSSYQQVTESLVPSSFRIWSGAYWGLLTAAFAHVDFWHVLFNMWWTRDFGTLLEPTMGRAKFVLFIASAAMVGCGAQLAISNQTGIGFSGVVYAMFGYALAARRVEPLYQRIINKQTIQWLLGWLVLCIVLSVTNVWQVGNGAHVAGLLFGFCIGNVFAARVWLAASRIGLALLVGLAVMSAVYMPWSKLWKLHGPAATYLALIEAATKGDPEAQYLHGFVLKRQQGRKSEALSWLKKSAEQGYVPAMNALAWTLATDPEDRLRDGAEAVKWAESACQKDNRQTPALLDTLAAAYAETEKWEEAVATQKQAISKLTGKEAEGTATYDSRLQKYLKREKMRE